MRVGIIGASGYVGGEALRLLFSHPEVEVTVATSRANQGEPLYRVHSNLRGIFKLKFTAPNIDAILKSCDFVFLATPHGVSQDIVPQLFASGIRIVDASADFRLKDPKDYEVWYGWTHRHPELLEKTVYGLPELHREDIKEAQIVAAPGCIAASAILALAPLMKKHVIDENRIVVDSKVGSSGSGVKPSLATHHAERYGVIRPYKPVGHRHTAEIEQELRVLGNKPVTVSLSVHAVNIVRGILSTCHAFTKEVLKPVDIWKLYKGFYRDEPFIRFVRDSKGIYRYPDPKILIGSNFCDIGFEIDTHSNRLVLLSAIDNLMKGAAGTAVQDMNIMMGFEETSGLKEVGLHPV